MGRWINGWMGECLDRQVGGFIDGWLDRWWADRWMEGLRRG